MYNIFYALQETTATLTMTPVKILQFILWTSLATLIGSTASAQKSPFEEGDDEEFFFMLESFTSYGGNIDVIDGLTGNEYHKGNEVVRAVHKKIPRIMGGFHKMLLDYEEKHINYRISEGIAHQKELTALARTFGIKNFDINADSHLRREKAIYQRLRAKPFFHIKEIVVWELDAMGPELPTNPYARNIRFDPQTNAWQRRALTQWDVYSSGKSKTTHIVKQQGLNLDTQEGFHNIKKGLPGSVQARDFREVSLSYPVIVSSEKSAEEQIKYLERSFIQNLRYLYDPFSWISRRKHRFRNGFSRELEKHIHNQKFKITDRKWFDPVLASFLNDCITVNRHGYGRIYEPYVKKAMDRDHKNQLGDKIDLLNWHPDESRTAKGKNKGNLLKKPKFKNPDNARFIMLDAYLRYGDDLTNALRAELAGLKKKKEKQDPISLIKRILEQVSNTPADQYIAKAFDEQRKLMEEVYAESLAPKTISDTKPPSNLQEGLR